MSLNKLYNYNIGTIGNINVTGLTTGTINATGLSSLLNANITNVTISNIVNTNLSTGTINSTGLTTGNINFTGELYQNGVAYLGSQWTSTSGNVSYTSGSVVATNLVSTAFSSGSINASTGLTTGTINATGLSTLTNTTATNVSAGVLIASTGLTTGTISASGVSALTNTTATNVSAGVLIASTGLTTGTISASGVSALTNTTATNVSAGVLIASTGLTTGTISASGTSTLQNVTAISVTTGTLTATTSVSSGLLSATNVIGDFISAGTLSGTTITGANLSLSGNLIVGGTLTTVNITSTNILNTNISVGTIIATGLSSLQNITGTNISSSTLNASTGITAASAQITNSNVTTSTIATARITSNLLAIGNSNTVGSIFTTGGNVGINTTSPGSALHVAGSIPVSPIGNGVHFGIDSNTFAAIQLNSTVGSYIDFGTSGGDYQARIIANTAGNIGIGAAGSAQLSVSHDFTISANSGAWNSTAGKGIFMRYSTNGGQDGAWIQSIDRSTGILYPLSLISKEFNIETNSVSRIFASSTGNIGIGTTAPSAKLHVGGSIHLDAETTSYLSSQTDAANLTQTYISFGVAGTANDHAYLRQIGGSNSYKMALDIHDDGDEPGFCIRSVKSTDNPDTINERFTVQANGNVGIGTSSPSGMLHLNNAALFTSTGNLTCTGDVVSFGSLSDARLKKNIETIQTEKALDIVSKLRAVTFDWKDDIFNEEKRDTSDLGFIAQEVEALVPEAVSEYTQIESGEVYKRIKHERLIPYLLSAIQYLLKEREK
jgi:hypothetical protein